MNITRNLNANMIGPEITKGTPTTSTQDLQDNNDIRNDAYFSNAVPHSSTRNNNGIYLFEQLKLLLLDTIFL